MSGGSVVLAAPSSHQGKTSVTLALIAAWKRRELRVGACKVGPDYIDSGLHRRVGADVTINLDLWAMRDEVCRHGWHELEDASDRIVVEGVMGLFDKGGRGCCTADVAAYLGLGVILVVDAAHMAQSAAALLKGFAHHRDDCPVRGVIFNRVGSARHASYLREAAHRANVPLLGLLPREPSIAIASRHLGLHQGHEMSDRLAHDLAHWLEDNADVPAIEKTSASSSLSASSSHHEALVSLRDVSHVAVARDEAFSFCYEWLARNWQRAGIRVSHFSPLAGEMPHKDCDAVMLVGGYPEHHLDSLGDGFFAAMRELAARGVAIYGECGGFMVLGRSVTDGDGVRHEMANLLPVDFSFVSPRRTLGYRRCRLVHDCFLGTKGRVLRGHEFHYGRITHQEGAPLFRMEHDEGGGWHDAGCRVGSVMGSFFHFIDFES